MSYRLAIRRDYSDLASGFVLRSAPGHPAFPVRLAEELFLRAASHLPAGRPIGLWDPCCGSGYLATVVGLLHRDRLRSVLCTDVDPEAVALAEGNLALLTGDGLAQRQREQLERANQFGKASHADAAQAAGRLAARLRATGSDLPAAARVADVFAPAQAALPAPPPDLVLTDIPYGRQTSWQGNVSTIEDPVRAMVGALTEVLPDHAVIALCAQARRVWAGVALERLRVGTRAGFIGRVGQLRART